MGKLTAVIDVPIARRPLEAGLGGHALTGNRVGHRNRRVEPDRALIHRTTDAEPQLFQTGARSDLDL